ncbi:unnamed protein product [Schistosoma mattheei]|uniref:Uncharacterized protein n=1 Tax=Schistosoma mattheei TaxID=31246 RepID=A0AA85BG20_9TREM|nr:unnamed protein product [Schistosoma mattheei]
MESVVCNHGEIRFMMSCQHQGLIRYNFTHYSEHNQRRQSNKATHKIKADTTIKSFEDLHAAVTIRELHFGRPFARQPDKVFNPN